jgi:DNA-binding transcriptional MerR regulator
MQRNAHQHKAATQTGLTVAQIDALITAYEARRTQIEYRHEQREELSAAKRDMENHTALEATAVKASLHTAKIGAYVKAFATVTESLSGLAKSRTPARAAAYAAALITVLDAIGHLFK